MYKYLADHCHTQRFLKMLLTDTNYSLVELTDLFLVSSLLQIRASSLALDKLREEMSSRNTASLDRLKMGSDSNMAVLWQKILSQRGKGEGPEAWVLTVRTAVCRQPVSLNTPRDRSLTPSSGSQATRKASAINTELQWDPAQMVQQARHARAMVSKHKSSGFSTVNVYFVF